MSTKLSFILLSKTRILLAIFLLSIASGSIAQSVTIGVSIPSATHGWAGGLNFHAEQSKARLEAENPDLKIVLVTANSASEQANDLEDLVAIHNIDALVILPFESAPLTGPVRNVKRRGVFVTVVDRGLSEEGIADVYVAGNNAEMGRVSAEYIKEALDNTGDIVVLRGIPICNRYSALRRIHDGARRQQHQRAGPQIRKLEPRRWLQRNAGLPCALPEDRCGLGAG